MINLATLTPMQRARVSAQLAKRFRFTDGIMTLGEWLERQPAIVKSESDGSIDYSRRRFNSMNHAEQLAYEARLKNRRYYWINSTQVPKVIYDAMVAS